MLRATLALLIAATPPPLDLARLARLLGLDPPGGPRAELVGMPAPVDWPAQVLGTMVSPTPRFSLAAVFYLPGRSVVTLAVGDRLAGSEVVGISRGAITLRTAEGLRRVEVNPRVPPPPPGGPRAVVSAERTIRRDALDLDQLSTGARGVPAFRQGALVGIRLFAIRPGSVYDQAGLRAGDVIQRINGHRLDSPDAALEAYQELRTAQWVEVEVHRDDSVLMLRYQLQ